MSEITDAYAAYNVSKASSGESLMDAHAHWFLLASALLALGAPIFGVYLILSMYIAERDEIIASEAPR